jgi:hypothetical protein
VSLLAARYVGEPVFLPVQCCCEPGRRFGWVPVPLAKPGRVHFLATVFKAKWESVFPQAETIHTDINIHESTPFPTAPFKCATQPGVYHYSIPLRLRRLAVSSGDYPIETWRRVVGFVESDKVGCTRGEHVWTRRRDGRRCVYCEHVDRGDFD